MRNKNVVIITITGIICLACVTAFVGNGICQYGETKARAAAGATAPVKVNNTVCPVTGEAVSMKNPATMRYNGKIYNLCCPMCEATFESNPEKYSKIAEEQAKGAGQ